MIQRLFVLLLLQSFLLTGYTAEPAAPANPAPARKSAEANFTDGLDCLKQSNRPCAQLALALIPAQSPYAKLLAGNIAAADQDFDTALRLLLPLQAENGFVSEANASLHASLALAYESHGDHLRALEQRTLADTYLPDDDSMLANQQGIWRLLGNLSRDELIDLRGESSDSVMQGWIDLALALRAADASAKSIQQWRTSYPDHPVSEKLLAQLRPEQPVSANASNALQGPIALLLPLAVEAYYPAADAIDRGFRAAQAADGDRTAVKLYATHGDPLEIRQIYEQAIAEGAKLVVGPLTRDEVDGLAASNISLPTLTLNSGEIAEHQPNLYTFGLSVESEAQQIAEIANGNGMQSAIIIASDNGLSGRMAQAFSSSWGELGGKIALQVTLAEGADFNQIKAQLASHPADMILLALGAEEARAIRPQLDIATPTFGFSHIYAGISDEPANQVLTAVRFVDIPWLLAPGDANYVAYRTSAVDLPQGEMQRWFALGVDAYHLLKLITTQAGKTATLRGLSGKIQIGADGEISRELAQARFSNNGVVLEKLP